MREMTHHPRRSVGRHGEAQVPRGIARDQAVLAAVLLTLAAVAWMSSHLLASPDMQSGLLTRPAMPGMGMSMSWSFYLFMLSWLVMMTAMMLPAVVPVVCVFDRWVRRSGRPRGATALFAAGYLTVWGMTGVVAFVPAVVLSSWTPTNDAVAARLGAVALLCAGLYQLSPLKRACLRRCRSPLGVITKHGRLLATKGWGPLAAGALHGLYCVGCCWLLMSLLFVLGVMSLVWMGVIAAFVSLEKLVGASEWACAIGAAVLCSAAVLLMLSPRLLPAMS